MSWNTSADVMASGWSTVWTVSIQLDSIYFILATFSPSYRLINELNWTVWNDSSSTVADDQLSSGKLAPWDATFAYNLATLPIRSWVAKYAVWFSWDLKAIFWSTICSSFTPRCIQENWSPAGPVRLLNRGCGIFKHNLNTKIYFSPRVNPLKTGPKRDLPASLRTCLRHRWSQSW